VPIESVERLSAGLDGIFKGKRCLLHDRDPVFTSEFLNVLAESGVVSVRLPARSPNLNAYATKSRQQADLPGSETRPWRRASATTWAVRRLAELLLQNGCL